MRSPGHNAISPSLARSGNNELEKSSRGLIQRMDILAIKLCIMLIKYFLNHYQSFEIADVSRNYTLFKSSSSVFAKFFKFSFSVLALFSFRLVSKCKTYKTCFNINNK